MYFSFIYLIFLLNETHFITTLTSTGALLVNLCLFIFLFFFLLQGPSTAAQQNRRDAERKLQLIERMRKKLTNKNPV